MGQNNSFHFNITNVLKDWMAVQQDRSVLVNIKTHQELQCFYIHIPFPQIQQELNIYNTRMQALHPHIARIAYYTQVPSPNTHPHPTFAVYSDRLILLNDNEWTLPRFRHALQAVSALAPFYGYFRLTEKTMRANEKGETKVWISQNPANNHRDYALASEEQAVAALAGLAVRKNYEVANLLIGCKSLNQALFRLERPQRRTSSPLSNKANTSMNQGRYKNVFRDTQEGKEVGPKFTVGVLSSIKQELKPYSHCADLLAKQKREARIRYDSPQGTRNNSRNEIRPETQLYQPNRKQLQQRSNNSISISRSSKPNHPQPPSRMPLPLTSLNSAPFTKSFMKVEKELPVDMAKHQSKPQSSAVWSELRNAKTPDFHAFASDKKLSRSPFQRKAKVPVFIQERRKDKESIKQVVGSFYNKSQKSQEYILTPKATLHEGWHQSNSGNNFKSTEQSFKNAEMGWSGWRAPRREKKLFTFKGKTPNKVFSTSFSPHSHAPLTPPPSRNLQNNMSVYFRKPNRTKTTEFNEKSTKIMPKSLALLSPENKSFVHHTDNSYILQSQKSFEHQGNERVRGKVCHSQAIAEEISENIPTSKSIAVSPNPQPPPQDQPHEKVSLKKQLKLEFGDLLGPSIPPNLISKHISPDSSELPQSNLKEKIEQKKMAFAQLKKQALAVLTDLL